MVDVQQIVDDRLAALKKSSKGLFDKLAHFAGEEAAITASARNATQTAIDAAQAAATRAGNALNDGQLGKIGKQAFDNAFKSGARDVLANGGYMLSSASNAVRNTLGGIVGGVKEFAGKTTNAAGQTISGPPGRVRQFLVKGPNWLGNAAKNNKKTAAVIGVGSALAAGYAWLSGRDKANAENEYAAKAQQVMAMQQQAAMMEAQAAQMQGRNPYYGGVTREEAAAMEAQMRTGGQNGGFAAAELQKRQAAAAAMNQVPAASA